MKRAPLKRGESQLKRTPLARTGKINPRATRHRDTAESLAIRDQYRTQNTECELSPFLKRLGQIHHIDESGVECHHICGGNFGRLDLVSNLIMLSPTLHHWVESEPALGRLCCLVVKGRKKPPEINADEFRLCSGMYLKGWIENHPPVCMPCLEQYRQKLLSSL